MTFVRMEYVLESLSTVCHAKNITMTYADLRKDIVPSRIMALEDVLKLVR